MFGIDQMLRFASLDPPCRRVQTVAIRAETHPTDDLLLGGAEPAAEPLRTDVFGPNWRNDHQRGSKGFALGFVRHHGVNWSARLNTSGSRTNLLHCSNPFAIVANSEGLPAAR